MKHRLLIKALKLSEFDYNLHKEKITETTLDFLVQNGVPSDLIQLFSQFSFTQSVRIGHVYFDKVNDFKEHNLDEMNRKCIEEGLLIIGIGLNGDPIVVDLANSKAGFVFHDQLYEDQDIIKVREAFISLDCSIEAFYLNSVVINDYPVDAYQAEDYIN